LENPPTINIPLLIVFVTVGFLILIAFSISFVLYHQKKKLKDKAISEEKEKNHQRELLKTSLDVAEMERKRIAANLHDDVGAALNLAKINIIRMAKLNNSIDITELSSESKLLLESTMENIRNISRDLAPPVLLRSGFEEALRDLCSSINTSGSLKVNLTGIPTGLKPSEQSEIQLYRILQELINNVLKHANASMMEINVADLTGKLNVNIKHDGKGIDDKMLPELTANSKGIGLKSIQSRANSINAKISYFAKNNSGSVINMEVPL
jgi:signal transduction histidine kinase